MLFDIIVFNAYNIIIIYPYRVQGGKYMNISFDESTKNALNKQLLQKNKSSVRLLIKGFG